MANSNNITPAQLNLLLKMAGKQLNVDPNTLRQQLENGDLSSVNANISTQMQQQINDVLSNPQKLQQIVSQTDLQQLLKNMR